MSKFLEERVNDLENEVQSLKLIVHQLRKPSTEVVGALAIDFEADADVLEFEGNQYRKVDREARVGDVVIMTGKTESNVIHAGRPYKVDENKQIEGFGVYRNEHGLNRTPETVDVYELIVEDKQPVQHQIAPCVAAKSANQLRAEIIEKAKVFVKINSTRSHRNVETMKPIDGKGLVSVYFGHSDKLEFVVNVEKRTVVALIKGLNSNTLFHRGIAKCDPSDVFNEHIGRAIALGRALSLDVSEFEQAVQPTEVVVGHVVETFINDGEHHETFEVGSVTRKRKIELRHVGETQNFNFTPFEIEYGDRIINDTNAIYGGVE